MMYLDNQKYIYLVFSSTPFKTGRFIRRMTGEQYNHIAISLDPSLTTLYSFARHYLDTPFYGGFIKENALRYIYNDECSQIKVYAVPVSDAQLKNIARRLFVMNINAAAYRYNLISALFTPFHIKVAIENAFTCIEFVVKLLGNCGIGGVNAACFYKFSDLQNLFEDYAVYEGPYLGNGNESLDDIGEYFEKRNIAVRTGLTVWSNTALFFRLVKSRLIHRYY